MPRQARCSIKTNFYHIMTQGINKSFIFNNNQEIKTYIKYMYALTKEHNIKIMAYCIMNNHAHILIETENVNDLSMYMKRLNGKYGMYYNYIYERVGVVFRNRYKSEGIYSKNQLNNCINYIYNNPVKARICDHPSEYAYSNFKEGYEKYQDDYVFMDTDEDIENVCNETINKFLSDNAMDINELKFDKEKLFIVIGILRKYKITWENIEEKLKIKMHTLKNIYYKMKK